MDKFWTVLLFLFVFLLVSSIVKRLAVRFINSADNKKAVSVITAEKEDPKVFFAEEGLRRDFEKAEYTLPEEDFFENEKNEFSESFEEEFNALSDDEARMILEESGLFEKEGEA